MSICLSEYPLLTNTYLHIDDSMSRTERVIQCKVDSIKDLKIDFPILQGYKIPRVNKVTTRVNEYVNFIVEEAGRI